MTQVARLRSITAGLIHRFVDSQAALALLGKIVNGADTDNSPWQQPEGSGLSAIADGFLSLGSG